MNNMISTHIRNAVKSVFAPAAFAFLFSILAIPATVQAGDGITTTPVEVKLVGHIDESPVVRIEFNNTAKEQLSVILKDAQGSIVYSERFNGEKFSKNFQFEKGAEDLTLTLTIRSKTERRPVVFQINKNVRVVEDVVVTKL
ncbi:hypothetical protein V9K67_25715 [Paraflavisolibacter sp. H34]|uniref:hypothetical protein n=1 Tax=Huijunlia imazamoxiresistens TaxID=3127457 RepID=UPI00301AA30B